MKSTNYENVLKKTLFFFFIMISLGSYAQEVVKGVIKSSNDLPLPGVTILQKEPQTALSQILMEITKSL